LATIVTHASKWEQNLICPTCKGQLKTTESALACGKCHSIYPIIDGVPCFLPDSLNEHQKAELDSILSRFRNQKTTGSTEKTPATKITPRWLEGKLDGNTVNKDTRIVCLGGAMVDDVPHVQSSYKFNVDHLAHEYIKLFPQMAQTQAAEGTIKHIASTTETLPFNDSYADVVYSRNSLDHVNNPIKTLMEIHRILKTDGKYYLSVYFNSNFIDCCETTTIDQDFLENHIKRLFNVASLEICPVEEEGQPPSAKCSLPNGQTIEWLHAVCVKKTYQPYDQQAIENYGDLTTDFHTALYYDEIFQYPQAAHFFHETLKHKPFLESDKMRLLYSKIRYLSISDHEGFKAFLNEFEQSNNDPFWWRIVILSAGAFMKKAFAKEVANRFSGEERELLERSLNAVNGLNFKRFVKNRKTLYKLSKPLYRVVKPFMRNNDFFKRTVF
jgi:uncharacterized protein YbaR (Trm112 family)/SAM-dependent methyltransferase